MKACSKSSIQHLFLFYKMWNYHPNLLKANLMLDLQESQLWYFSFLFVFLGYNKQPLILNLKIPFKYPSYLENFS